MRNAREPQPTRVNQRIGQTPQHSQTAAVSVSRRDGRRRRGSPAGALTPATRRRGGRRSSSRGERGGVAAVRRPARQARACAARGSSRDAEPGGRAPVGDLGVTPASLAATRSGSRRGSAPARRRPSGSARSRSRALRRTAARRAVLVAVVHQAGELVAIRRARSSSPHAVAAAVLGSDPEVADGRRGRAATCSRRETTKSGRSAATSKGIAPRDWLASTDEAGAGGAGVGGYPAARSTSPPSVQCTLGTDTMPIPSSIASSTASVHVCSAPGLDRGDPTAGALEHPPPRVDARGVLLGEHEDLRRRDRSAMLRPRDREPVARRRDQRDRFTVGADVPRRAASAAARRR